MGFPPRTSPHVPLAIVTTSGTKVTAVTDRQIKDVNRAEVRQDSSDPGNVFRVTSGYINYPGGGIAYYDATADPILTRHPTLATHSDLTHIVGTEVRSEIASEEVATDPDAIPSSEAVTLRAFWIVDPDLITPSLPLPPPTLTYDLDWPGGSAAGWPASVAYTKAATITFTAVLRLGINGLRDQTAGTVDSITDERASFGV